MRNVPLKVVIDDAHLSAQDAVQRAVAAVGLRIEECFPEIGTIFGSVDESLVGRIERVDGVLHAQQEAGYRVPPLDPKTPQ